MLVLISSSSRRFVKIIPITYVLGLILINKWCKGKAWDVAIISLLTGRPVW
jgi:hypothetical protein